VLPPSGAQMAQAHTLAKQARAAPPRIRCACAWPIVDARAYARDARVYDCDARLYDRDARVYDRDARVYDRDARSYGRKLPRHSATNVIRCVPPN
jgi:hypothetical protein